MSDGKHIVQLRDGRRLAYWDYGDPRGLPVLLFHGAPGAGRPPADAPAVAAREGVHVIAPNRPGYGESDARPGRTLLDWPGDVEQLVDHLGWQRFAVVGKSAGGPHAAACAAALGERVAATVLVGCPAPPDLEGSLRRYSPTDILLGGLGRWLPAGVFLMARTASWAFKHLPRTVVATMRWRLGGPDRRLLADRRVRAAMLEKYREGYRQGSGGHAQDLELLGRPWGFDIRRLDRVGLWHGSHDRVIPVSIGRLLSRTLPGAAYHELQAGHLLLETPEHWREILRELRALAEYEPASAEWRRVRH